MDVWIHNVKNLMGKNKYLRKMVPFFRGTKIVRYMLQFHSASAYKSRSIRIANETREKFQACYEAHRNEFARLAEMLEDDFSRKTLQTVVTYRLTPNPDQKILKPVIVLPQYFPRDIIKPAANEVFIDGGGFTGDTLLDLAAFWGRNWKKVYSWEPDEKNREQLIECCREQKYQNVEIIPCGLWSKQTELRFSQLGEGWSRISDISPDVIPVDTIDNVCWNDRVTFIKMDIEGSEMEALRSAERIICRDKPRLAISIYHKPEDHFEIPFLIRKMVPEYKLYIRHHRPSKNDTVLYAIYPG